MSVSETYVALFAAIGAADFLLMMWLVVTCALNALVFFHSERIEQSLNNALQVLYLLFSVFVIGRWAVLVSKVTEFLDSLREAGEALVPGSVTLLLGLAGLVFVVGFSSGTILYLRSRRRKTRVI